MNESDNLTIACPQCLSPLEINRGVCEQCGCHPTTEQLELLARVSKGVFYWGWQYGRSFFRELRESGSIQSRYSIDPVLVLGFLASAVAAGVIGNASYDALKALIEKFRSSTNTKSMLPPEVEDDEELKLLFDLAQAYLRYKKSPFAPFSSLAEVFDVLERYEPVTFLDPQDLQDLSELYARYDTAKCISLALVRTYRTDYLRFVLLKWIPSEAKQIFDLLAQRNFEQAFGLLTDIGNWDPKRIPEAANGELVGHVYRNHRRLGIVFELIENSLIAVSKVNSPEIAIEVVGRRLSVKDNGVGMDVPTLFQYFFMPGESGWLEQGYDLEKENTGTGITCGLMWLDQLQVESRTEDGDSCWAELEINDWSRMNLSVADETITIKHHTCGTTAQVLFCNRQRSSWDTGANLEAFRGMSDSEIEQKLIEEVEQICRFVGDEVLITLNGRAINGQSTRGAGPTHITVAEFPEYFSHMKNIGIEVYADSFLRPTRELTYEEQPVFRCSIELYRRDLFVCEDSMRWVLEKTPVELSSSQKARLNGTVIRCFLPTHIPLNIQKDGIAVHIKNIAPLVEAIVSLVH